MGTETAIPQPDCKREEHLSADGKWRSFPRVPNLLQYVNSGVYFGRNKIKNKVVRKSLQTTVWTTAKLRLVDFLKENRETQERVFTPKFKVALELFLQGFNAATNIKESSKLYRRDCVKKLQATWPELWELTIEEISPEACQEWGAKLCKEINGQYFNNMLGTLRMVIAAGIADHKKKTKLTLPNPAMEVKRVKIKSADAASTKGETRWISGAGITWLRCLLNLVLHWRGRRGGRSRGRGHQRLDWGLSDRGCNDSRFTM